MSIIEFKPSSWCEKEPINSSLQTKMSKYNFKMGGDFVDFELEDEKKLPKTSSKKLKSLTQTQVYDKACYVQCEAIMKRNEVAALIEKGAKRNYSDMRSAFGNLITFDFESDPQGRCIMVEKDSNGKTSRKTLFFQNTGEIIKIEETNPNSKTYNKISFFNKEKHFEVHKGIKEGLFKDTTKEIFGFENGRPTFYKKDCTKKDGRNIAKEEYIFESYYI